MQNDKSKFRYIYLTKLIKFLIITVSLITIHQSLLTREALAHCPLCTAGAGAGLAISRWLGIDDSITGIWMAAFLGATSLWWAYSIKRKYVPMQETLIYLVVFVSTIWSFYQFNLVSEHAGMIMGVPKLIFGMVSGGVIFYLVEVVNKLIRRFRGKVLFAYQPVIFSLGSMFILSTGMFIFINYYI